jgi:hypothetical protein
MPWLPRPSGTRALLALGLVLAVFGAGRSGAAEDQKNLQLDVIINGIPRNAIGSFVQFADGRMAAAPKELEELGSTAADGDLPTNWCSSMIFRAFAIDMTSACRRSKSRSTTRSARAATTI